MFRSFIYEIFTEHGSKLKKKKKNLSREYD